ncbi:MAG TPA: oxygenase MpaB family protein [Acidimicrobiia bacterium]|nr:oxygenase MpaB family protein [Acidimicrobiia bacterium]
MRPESEVRASLRRLVESLRVRVASSATSPFAHAPYPLAHTLDYPDDPGLLGPGSTSWRVMGDVATFVGGIRALLLQAAHPEVVAGVGDHSRYREDPLGRLSRTSAYVTATTYGAMPEVEAAVTQVRRIHRVVSGVSSRGRPYNANDPGYAAWVHNVLTDSFLVAHQTYGEFKLSSSEQDLFVLEQTRVGALLGSDPMPASAEGLSGWIGLHPDLAPSPEMDEAVQFLSDPPLDPALKLGYKILLEAAVATLPRRLLSILGLTRTPGAVSAGRVAVSGLRWALGYSPSWQLALIRTGSPVPEGRFKQKLVIER